MATSSLYDRNGVFRPLQTRDKSNNSFWQRSVLNCRSVRSTVCSEHVKIHLEHVKICFCHSMMTFLKCEDSQGESGTFQHCRKRSGGTEGFFERTFCTNVFTEQILRIVLPITAEPLGQFIRVRSLTSDSEGRWGPNPHTQLCSSKRLDTQTLRRICALTQPSDSRHNYRRLIKDISQSSTWLDDIIDILRVCLYTTRVTGSKQEFPAFRLNYYVEQSQKSSLLRSNVRGQTSRLHHPGQILFLPATRTHNI